MEGASRSSSEGPLDVDPAPTRETRVAEGRKKKKVSKKDRVRTKQQLFSDSSSAGEESDEQVLSSKTLSRSHRQSAKSVSSMLKKGSSLLVSNPGPLANSTPTNISDTEVGTSLPSDATPVSLKRSGKRRNKSLNLPISFQLSKARKRFGKALPSDADTGELAIFYKDLAQLETIIREEVKTSEDPEGEARIIVATQSKLLIPRRREEGRAKILLRSAQRTLVRCKAQVDQANVDTESIPEAAASLQTAGALFDKDIAEVITALRMSWWKEGEDPKEEELTAAQTSFNRVRDDLKSLKERISSGDGLKCRTIDLKPFVGDIFNGERELYPSWREGWRKAEEHLTKKFNATDADLFNQLIRMLDRESEAYKLARAKGGTKDEYKAALLVLDETFGDPISLAIQAMNERTVPLEKIPDKVKRLVEMNTRLTEEGVPLENLLLQQLVCRMARTNSFDAISAWTSYIKRKKLRAKDDSTNVSLNNVSGTDHALINDYLSPSLLQTFDVKDAYSIKGLSTFCNDLAADEDYRSNAKATGTVLLATGGAKSQRDRRPTKQHGKHPSGREGTLRGCVKHGPNASHTSDGCKILGTLSWDEFGELCGDRCRRCASFKHPHTCHQRCAVQGCGKPHLTSRHTESSGGSKRKATDSTAAPPHKKHKAKVSGKGKPYQRDNPKKKDHGTKPPPPKKDQT